ncbi:hypothetical protein N2W54_006855 [Lotmaria passim]
MSSVLSGSAAPAYGQRRPTNSHSHRHHNGGRDYDNGVLPAAGGVHQVARPRRAPLDRGIRRTTECPCAVRLYHLANSDIAARSEYCSVVLGAPSVGIHAAVRTSPLASNSGPPNTLAKTSATGMGEAVSVKVGDNGTPALSSSPAVARPVAVQLAWGDTTVWEVAHTALRAVRAEVDAVYATQRRQSARQATSGVSSGPSQFKDRPVGNATAAEEDLAKVEEEEDEAPYSTPLHRYEVELLTGSVNALGQAFIIPLCTVACRQVLPGHSALLPVHKHNSVDYHTALYELTYNLGDPVFVTCTRTL